MSIRLWGGGKIGVGLRTVVSISLYLHCTVQLSTRVLLWLSRLLVIVVVSEKTAT